QLIIFYDRKSLESFSQPHAVGNDAAIIFFELINGAKDTVSLKLVKLVPDNCILKACFGTDNALFIYVFEVIFENIIQRNEVHQTAWLIRSDILQLLSKLFFDVLNSFLIIPDRIEP